MILVVPAMVVLAVMVGIVADPKVALLIGLTGAIMLALATWSLTGPNSCAGAAPVLCERDRGLGVLIGSAGASLLAAGGMAAILWRGLAATPVARVLITVAAIAAAFIVYTALV